ncbi:formimidoylglutamase [Marinibactrum halimedae]|uniref:Formimidoylglutamase n=1 Tax=Marinibactrum halimedae TaxID=1444977 RepID=A0AA37WNI2_9GAMM|nr:formimidoylglutamase [Marinibactrum halimedae]MCD9459363.1 formimidoylglutamase [Marinibactrum halimedae]GLS27573.1 formimidoylglutamase [Marinibactrum halimedae]
MSSFKAAEKWQGRTDNEDGAQGVRWHHKVNQRLQEAELTLLGFACDIGVKNNKGRVGAKAGPEAIRHALANLAWHHSIQVRDAGTVVAQESSAQESSPQENNLERAQQQYAQALSMQLTNSSFVIGLGGGHEIGWGSYLGLTNFLAAQNKGQSEKKHIGIINLDAHFDLRLPAPLTSSGTPFWQVAEHCKAHGNPFHYACLGVSQVANTQALFHRAKGLGVTYVMDTQCTLPNVKDSLTGFLNKIDELYLTICLDVFPASVTPGVSAPSAMGIDPLFAIEFIHWLAQQQEACQFQWRLADIAEMNPTYDIDQRTAKFAARLIHELVTARFGGLN